MKDNIKKLFKPEELNAIADSIGEAEKKTSGEIRLSIRQKRQWKERKTTIEEMARREFQLLGMTSTVDRTGVLIFLLLQDRKFFILADEGIHTKVEQNTWNKIADEMATYFLQRHFYDGIIHGVQTIGGILSQYFPRKPEDKNELSNEVKIK